MPFMDVHFLRTLRTRHNNTTKNKHTLKSVRLTTVAMEKQKLIHILCVFVCL